MSDDDPILENQRRISDVVRDIPKNEFRVDLGADQAGGANLEASVEREVGKRAGGVTASVSQRKGWSVAGFYRRMFGGNE